MNLLLIASALAGSVAIIIFMYTLSLCLTMRGSKVKTLSQLFVILTVLSVIKMMLYESSYVAIPTILCNIVLVYYLARSFRGPVREVLPTIVSGYIFCLILPDAICCILVDTFLPGVFDRNPLHAGTTISICATNGFVICLSVLFCFIVQKIKKTQRASVMLYVFIFLSVLFITQTLFVWFTLMFAGISEKIVVIIAFILFCCENVLLAFFMLREVDKMHQERMEFLLNTDTAESTFFLNKQEITNEEMAKIRHDLKNHLGTIQILLENHSEKDAAELASEILNQIN